MPRQEHYWSYEWLVIWKGGNQIVEDFVLNEVKTSIREVVGSGVTLHVGTPLLPQRPFFGAPPPLKVER